MSETQAKRKLPDWAKDPFLKSLGYQRQLNDFYGLSLLGLQAIFETHQEVEELAAELQKLEQETGVGREVEGLDPKFRVTVRERAQLASREIKQGFPVLNAQATISIWASLEWLVRDLIVGLVANDPSSRRNDTVRKVRIRLSDYEELAGNEKYYYVVDQIERDLGASLKVGVDRFESLLAVFGLSGPVDKGVKATLFELSQIRNVLVHRGGVAGTRITQALPSRQLKLGERVVVGIKDYVRYMNAALDYENTLLGRLQAWMSK